MNEREAMQNALGYAAGREDASGIRTVSPTAAPGFLTFAEQFAAAQKEFNSEKRHYLPSTCAAYDAWQQSGGRSIIPTTMAAFDSGPRSHE